jgi:hypothetical protein
MRKIIKRLEETIRLDLVKDPQDLPPGTQESLVNSKNPPGKISDLTGRGFASLGKRSTGSSTGHSRVLGKISDLTG